MPPKRKPAKPETAVEEEMPKRVRPTRNAAEKANKVAEVEAPKAKEKEKTDENGASGDAPKKRGRAAKASVEEKEPEAAEAAPKAKRAAKPKAATKAAVEKPPAKAKATRGRAKANKAKEDEEEPEEDKAPVKKTKKKEREEDEEEAPAAKTVKPELEDEEEQTKDPSVTRRRYKKQEPQEAKEDDVPVKRNKKQPSAEEKEDKAPAKKPKKAAAAVSEDTKTKKADKPVINTTETDHQSIDYSCERKNANGDLPNFKISTWNVGGIRSWVKKDGLKYITAEDPDIFCLQEVKCSEDKLPEEVKVPGYKTYWCGSDKEGYAGVALYSKTEPIEVKYGIENEEFDDEGRCITAEYEQFYLINVYVPNAGRGLVTLPKRLSWNDVFKAYVKELDSKKPVIVCGDMNVAHNEIDIANPKSNKKSAGFTQEERDGMTDFLGEGYVDSYRELYPDQTDVYTYWTYMAKARSKNIGWRLDYFIVSKRFMDTVCDNVVRSQVFGSDHCPVVLFVHL